MSQTNSANSREKRCIAERNGDFDLDRLNDKNNWRRKLSPIGIRNFKRQVAEITRRYPSSSPIEKSRIQKLKEKIGDMACPSADHQVIRRTRLIPPSWS